MSVKKVTKCDWKELKDIIHAIYKGNTLLSPYQSYEFLNTVGLGKNDRNPFQTLGYTAQNFVLFDESNEPVAVAPLYSKKNKNGYDILLRGHVTSAGHLDFIYRPDFSFEDYQLLMQEIKKYYKKGVIHFDRISEFSLTYKYACQDNNAEKTGSILVTVKLPETYDEWYKGLSKSVRQNIRTSYNRMKTDEKEFEFHLYYKEKMPDKVRDDVMHLFCRRLCDHSKIHSKFVEKVLYVLKRKHPMTLGIVNDPGFIGATLYIDGVLAAFYDAIVGNDQRILVPRLSINIDLGRYSPGGVLINETMKQIIGNDNFKEFDLQRGDEPYKFSYGGVEYQNYEWNTEI